MKNAIWQKGRDQQFSEECDLAEGKGSARRAAEQTGQKTGYIYSNLEIGDNMVKEN